MNKPDLKRVRRESVADQVSTQIINLIRSGSLKAGDRLPSERDLAQDMGVGRPALREATRALSMLGIIDVRHGGGIFVSDLSPEALFGPLHFYIGLDEKNILEINEARRVIEGSALAYAAVNFPDTLLQDLKRKMAEIEHYFQTCGDGDADLLRIQHDAREFRQIIKKGIKNPIINRVLDGLDVMSTAARTQLEQHRDSWQPLVNAHKAIVTSLENHDPAAAQQAVHNLLDTMERFGENASKDKDKKE